MNPKQALLELLSKQHLDSATRAKVQAQIESMTDQVAQATLDKIMLVQSKMHH